ncbi:MAG: nickel ABC transporter permease [Fidelibacterota bacterium]
MITFIIKRILSLIPILLGVTILSFSIIHLAPGDPVRMMLGPEASAEDIIRIRNQLGLDRPVIVQYFVWLGKTLKGDLGRSLRTNEEVAEEILSRFPATIELALLSTILALFTGVVVGSVSAVKQYSFIDNFSRIAAFIFLSMPSFWLGLVLIIIFSLHLNLFPASGRAFIFSLDGLKHLFLPSITLGIGSGAFLARIMRSSMLEILRQDYITMARSKGLKESRVIYKHSLKNALIPFITISGMTVGTLLGGAVIVETVFAWPGVGKLVVDSIKARDFPVTQGAVLLIAVIFVFINLIVDILYAYIDPRIKYERYEF